MSQPLTFVILTTGPDAAQELRSALAADRRARVIACSDRAEQVYAEVVRSRPSAVIITIDTQPEAAWTLCRRIIAFSPETVIICALRNSSPDLIIESMRAGAREFLRLPIIAEEFKTVLDRTVEFCSGESTAVKKRGRVVAVFSIKGGCGTSFIAANLAVALNAPAVLVDLNLQAGDLDVFFGIQPKFSIADLISNRKRLDEGLMASYLSQHSNNLSVLPAPRHAEAVEEVKPEHLPDVLRVLQERYEYVVIDLPHSLDAITLAALDLADDILLVFNLDILSARGAQRTLYIFDRVGYPRQKLHLVINRLGKQRDLQLEQVERFLGERVECHISADPAAVINSINHGQPLAGSASNSPVVAEIQRLAAIFGATPPETDGGPRKGLLGSLFRRQTANLEVGFTSVPDKAPAES
jgi:pilus assembly protein CpaE